MQLLLAVECSKESKSDEMYIKSFINKYFDVGFNKLSFVYLNGKTNYKNIKNTINKKVREYSGSSHVIFCLDTDSNTPDNKALNDDIVSFASTNNFDLVWFCKDIEDVFLNRKISKNVKSDTATSFYKKKDYSKIKVSSFSINKNWNELNPKNSNLYTIINKYLNSK